VEKMQLSEQKYIVTIIVPVYNIQDYVARCIESIQKQTYKKLEILLVNDGSKDESRIICEEYAKRDARIRIIDKANGGLSDARNVGIDQATGDYLVFLDGDDYLKDTYVESLLDAIVDTQAEVALCSFELVDDNGTLLKQEILSELGPIATGYDILNNVLTSYGYKYVVAWNKMYARHVFQELRFDKGKIYEDEFINFRLFWNCKKVCIVNKPLYCYVQRGGSITQSSMTIEKINTKSEMHRTRIQFYKDKKNEALYMKACQLYCNWLVECTKEYADLFSKEAQKICQKDMRLYAKEANQDPQSNMSLKIQNGLGSIDLKMAATMKRLYKG
jgi:glycosyltransferase involved in cell wall biosynthesis